MVYFVQAYLQAKEKHSRDIYLKIRDSDRAFFGVDKDKVLKIERPVYLICDSEGYWGATFESFIKNKLQVTPLDGDLSLYLKTVADSSIGHIGAYVEDILFAGNADLNFTIYFTTN